MTVIYVAIAVAFVGLCGAAASMIIGLAFMIYDALEERKHDR